ARGARVLEPCSPFRFSSPLSAAGADGSFATVFRASFFGTSGLGGRIGVGMIADRIGIEHTLVGVSFMPLLAAACALPLPARANVATGPQPAEVIVVETRP
ncbi:MAG: hypothetical protein M3P13_08950, partial [Acidobacteriota bacterium]|nr:hypothetical protein [Acidobacteriota bacterium]